MNYQMFKSIIDSLVKNFKCPECSSWASESNIDIVGIAGTTVNLSVKCSTCGKHTPIKAEMAQVNLGEIAGFDKQKIQQLKEQLEAKLKNVGGFLSIHTPQPVITINEKEIIDLKNKLKKENIWVQDFFWEL